ncbi:MAG: AmmeMemoRadiSam system protein B [Rickettsiales bacterium]|jgi:MEMO1 family protein|nr:AmmeMemoRadiSam system protein B [Rickettsiales bacterium]
MTIMDNSAILKSKLSKDGWYPEDSNRLLSALDKMLTGTTFAEPVKAMICPHAGYIYSGNVLGKAAINISKNHYSKIIILGPCHYAAVKDLAILTNYQSIQTPIGTSNILSDDVDKLIKHPLFEIEDKFHKAEHSIQMQIPVLQYLCPETPILPIIFGSLSWEASKEIANQITQIIDNKTLIIVSSDFTHYGDNFDFAPFTDRSKGTVREQIESHDMNAINPILANDINSYQDFIRTENHTICGCYAIEVLMQLCKNNQTKFKLCDYKTSGDLTGDYSHSVSYAAIVALGRWE